MAHNQDAWNSEGANERFPYQRVEELARRLLAICEVHKSGAASGNEGWINASDAKEI